MDMEDEAQGHIPMLVINNNKQTVMNNREIMQLQRKQKMINNMMVYEIIRNKQQENDGVNPSKQQEFNREKHKKSSIGSEDKCRNTQINKIHRITEVQEQEQEYGCYKFDNQLVNDYINGNGITKSKQKKFKYLYAHAQNRHSEAKLNQKYNKNSHNQFKERNKDQSAGDQKKVKLSSFLSITKLDYNSRNTKHSKSSKSNCSYTNIHSFDKQQASQENRNSHRNINIGMEKNRSEHMIGIVNKANRKSQNYTNCNLNKINQIMRKIGTNKNKSKEVLKSDKQNKKNIVETNIDVKPQIHIISFTNSQQNKQVEQQYKKEMGIEQAGTPQKQNLEPELQSKSGVGLKKKKMHQVCFESSKQNVEHSGMSENIHKQYQYLAKTDINTTNLSKQVQNIITPNMNIFNTNNSLEDMIIKSTPISLFIKGYQKISNHQKNAGHNRNPSDNSISKTGTNQNGGVRKMVHGSLKIHNRQSCGYNNRYNHGLVIKSMKTQAEQTHGYVGKSGSKLKIDNQKHRRYHSSCSNLNSNSKRQINIMNQIYQFENLKCLTKDNSNLNINTSLNINQLSLNRLKMKKRRQETTMKRFKSNQRVSLQHSFILASL